ncbi:MAG: histone deacetylase [Desulfobacterales bacterium]|nr:MAG: histone deacetylase [Desulfobacterales bacterium]
MLRAKNRTGLVFFPAFDWAISATHPEREERLLYTQDQILEEGLLDIDGIIEMKPDLATIQDIQRVHFCVPDPWAVCTESHFISAGGAKTIGMAVMEGTIDRGFALIRPPGHHAHRVVQGGRGFCNINTEAIMIEYLRQAYAIDRVAIVDTDCHHGDGTQDIYWHDPDTLFISLHQDGRTLYPGTGFHDELGGPNAAGTTINIPLPPYTGDAGILYAIEETVLPILDEFQPQLIINSAGQDNHYSDPITNMNFSAQGYAKLTELLRADIAVLEGGYSIEGALPYVNAGIIMAMAGLDYSNLHEPDYVKERFIQSRKLEKEIKKCCAASLDVWRKRHTLAQKLRGKKDSHIRKRQMYYDTDDITEIQREEIRICDDCAGAIQIESEKGMESKSLCVHIPRKACSRCQEQAKKWYDSADPQTYDHIFLQDRTTDDYLIKGE